MGCEVLYVKANVADRLERENLVKDVTERLGRVNLLVNNAGIGPRVRADILEATEESFDEVLATNLRGPYFLTQSVAKWMIEQHKADAGF